VASCGAGVPSLTVALGPSQRASASPTGLPDFPYNARHVSQAFLIATTLHSSPASPLFDPPCCFWSTTRDPLLSLQPPSLQPHSLPSITPSPASYLRPPPRSPAFVKAATYLARAAPTFPLDFACTSQPPPTHIPWPQTEHGVSPRNSPISTVTSTPRL